MTLPKLAVISGLLGATASCLAKFALAPESPVRLWGRDVCEHHLGLLSRCEPDRSVYPPWVGSPWYLSRADGSNECCHGRRFLGGDGREWQCCRNWFGFRLKFRGICTLWCCDVQRKSRCKMVGRIFFCYVGGYVAVNSSSSALKNGKIQVFILLLNSPPCRHIEMAWTVRQNDIASLHWIFEGYFLLWRLPISALQEVRKRISTSRRPT